MFFLIVSLYFAWGEFFSVTDQKTTKQTEILEDSPEWRAFLSRRQDIENDPTLDEQSKKVLTDNWLVMASESKPHMAAPHNQMFKNPNWAKPSMLFLMMGSSLVLAGAFSYSIGAVYPSAFSNSSPSVDQVDQAATASTGHPGDGVSLQERLAGLQKKLVSNRLLTGFRVLNRFKKPFQIFTDFN